MAVRPPEPSTTPPAPLPPGVRHALAALVAAGALGLSAQVARAVGEARAAGATPSILREALLLLVPYVGHPRALAAFKAAGPLGGPAGSDEADPGQRAVRGRQAFEAVYGPTAGRVLDGLAALDPCLPAWTLEHAYGRVLARPGLALVERELLGVSLLTALGGLDDALLGHLRGAARLGASAEALAAAVAALPDEVPEAHRVAARALLARVAARG